MLEDVQNSNYNILQFLVETAVNKIDDKNKKSGYVQKRKRPEYKKVAAEETTVTKNENIIADTGTKETNAVAGEAGKKTTMPEAEKLAKTEAEQRTQETKKDEAVVIVKQEPLVTKQEAQVTQVPVIKPPAPVHTANPVKAPPASSLGSKKSTKHNKNNKDAAVIDYMQQVQDLLTTQAPKTTNEPSKVETQTTLVVADAKPAEKTVQKVQADQKQDAEQTKATDEHEDFEHIEHEEVDFKDLGFEEIKPEVSVENAPQEALPTRMHSSSVETPRTTLFFSTMGSVVSKSYELTSAAMNGGNDFKNTVLSVAERALNGYESAKLTEEKVNSAIEFAAKVRDQNAAIVIKERKHLYTGIQTFKDDIESENLKVKGIRDGHGAEKHEYEAILEAFKEVLSQLESHALCAREQLEKVMEYDRQLSDPQFQASHVMKQAMSFTSKMLRLVVILKFDALYDKRLRDSLNVDLTEKLLVKIKLQIDDNNAYKNDDDLSWRLQERVTAVHSFVVDLEKKPKPILSKAKDVTASIAGYENENDLLQAIKDLINSYMPKEKHRLKPQ